MKNKTVIEGDIIHAGIEDRKNPSSLWRQLARLADRSRVPNAKKILYWLDRKRIKVGSWAGIIEVGDLHLEILPRFMSEGQNSEESRMMAAENLLTMLVAGGRLDMEPDFAMVKGTESPLMDTLISHFTQRLWSSLQRGSDRAFYRTQETPITLKGKIGWGKTLARYGMIRDRFVQEFTQFGSNTPINRIFCQTANFLLPRTTDTRTRLRLIACLNVLTMTHDAVQGRHKATKIVYRRNNRHFRPLVNFCRQILRGHLPLAGESETHSFSLMVNLPRSFERYLSALITQEQDRLGCAGCEVVSQSSDVTRYLAWSPSKTGKKNQFVLRPDILILSPGKSPIILDTKWKCPPFFSAAGGDVSALSRADKGRPSDMSRDHYQMVAYLFGINAESGILLYPQSGEPVMKVYRLHHQKGRLGVATINLTRSLRFERQGLLDELSSILTSIRHEETNCEF